MIIEPLQYLYKPDKNILCAGLKGYQEKLEIVIWKYLVNEKVLDTYVVFFNKM